MAESDGITREAAKRGDLSMRRSPLSVAGLGGAVLVVLVTLTATLVAAAPAGAAELLAPARCSVFWTNTANAVDEVELSAATGPVGSRPLLTADDQRVLVWYNGVRVAQVTVPEGRAFVDIPRQIQRGDNHFSVAVGEVDANGQVVAQSSRVYCGNAPYKRGLPPERCFGPNDVNPGVGVVQPYNFNTSRPLLMFPDERLELWHNGRIAYRTSVTEIPFQRLLYRRLVSGNNHMSVGVVRVANGRVVARYPRTYCGNLNYNP